MWVGISVIAIGIEQVWVNLNCIWSFMFLPYLGFQLILYVLKILIWFLYFYCLYKLVITVSFDISTVLIGHVSKWPGAHVSVHVCKLSVTYDKNDQIKT
jgi:hypothetical protein